MILRETYQVDSMENYAMAAKPSIDPARFLDDQVASASPDLLRSLLITFVDALMSAASARSLVRVRGAAEFLGLLR